MLRRAKLLISESTRVVASEITCISFLKSHVRVLRGAGRLDGSAKP